MKTHFLLFVLLFVFCFHGNAQDITSNLEVWYKFDYKNGDISLKDHSGNGRDLVPSKWGQTQDWSSLQWGTETLSQEQQGYIYFPDGRDDNVVLSNAADNHWTGITGTSARTLCAWIRIDAGSNDNAGRYMLWYGDESKPGGCYKIALKGHSVELESGENTAANQWCNRNVGWLNDASHPQATWHHFALVYDGQGNRSTGFKLYMNGNPVDFNPVNPSADLSINTVAQYGPEIGRYMVKMALADFRYYSRALTLAEINKIREGELPFAYTIANLGKIIQTAINNHETQVVIPPGVYRGKAPFLNFNGASNLKIIADGVTMLCETKVRALQFESCSNITLQGLTIDYNPLTFTQGDIIAVGSNYVDVKIHAGYPVEAYSRIDVIDPDTRYRKRGSKFVWNATAQIMDEGVVRVFQPDLPSVARVGDLASMSTGPEGQYGAPHAFVLSNCQGGMVLDRVTIHSAPGFGIFESGGKGGSQLTGCRIVPGPTPEGATESRLLTTSWDAIQHTLLHTGPLMENCRVEDAGDDSWSVTWDGSYTIDSATGDRITVAGDMGTALQAGDTLRTSLHSEYAVIDRKSGIILILDKNCPWAVGTKVYSPNRRCENFVLRNNYFRSSGRVLVKAGKGLIENNVMDNGHSGVTVNSEDALTAIDQLTIRNNKIIGTGHFMPASWSNQAGAISIVNGSGSTISPVGSFEKIVIENNEFSDVSGVNIVVTSTKDLRIKGNRFYKTGITTPNNTGSECGIEQNTVVYLKNCDVVFLDSNAVINRNLQALVKQYGITNLTQLRGGVFDSTDSGIKEVNSPEEAFKLYYNDRSIVFEVPGYQNRITLHIYDSMGRLEQSIWPENCSGKTLVPYQPLFSGIKIVRIQSENRNFYGKIVI